MDCREYTADFLAAHVDGELDAGEHRAAEAHLAGCADCRARLEDERALKTLLRERLRRATVPGELRAAIRAHLDDIDGPGPRARWRDRVAVEMRRPWAWAPLLALAAAVVLMVAVRGRFASQAPVANFDLVIEKYRGFENHFVPNVPSDSFGSVAQHYHSARMPSYIWNFQPFGFKLVGGRIDRLPDGRPVTYTFYRGDQGAVMCTRFQVDKVAVPPGGRKLDPDVDQYLYSYRGYSVVLGVDYERRWICILISRLPAREFARDVMFLEH